MQFKLIGVVCVTSFFIFSEYAGAETWTLGASIERAYQQAPEIKLAETELEARKSAIDSATFWPNPTLDARIDNQLGLEDGSGGYDVNEIGITQPIPLARLKYQKNFAQASVQVAEHELALQRLLLETAVAKEFHELQLAQAEHRIAKERLSIATDMQATSVKNKQGVIVRYMTPLEKMRLDILKEEASQEESKTAGRYKEVLNRFVKRLNLDASNNNVTANETVTALQPLTTLPDLNYFIEQQSAHASLAAQQQNIIAARAEIAVAKSRQLNDPEIRLSRSVDYFSQGEAEVYGLTLNVQVPLWNNKSPEISRAEYNTSQQQIELQKMARELQIQVTHSHTHISHLIQQLEQHQKKVLQPSAEIIKLTNKGFTSGELGLLTLIDANNTYFDAQLRYAEMLYETWIEYAELRRAAGLLYATTPVASNPNTNGAM